MKKKMFGLLTAAMLAATSTGSLQAFAAAGEVFRVGNGQNQYRGNSDGYSYEIWLDNTGGSGSMTLGSGATFKAEWSASVSRGNYLARRGLSFGSKQVATDYQYIGMDYEASYQQTGSASGNSRLCVYGWFENQGAPGNPPLVEYYIIEDWVDWCPDGNGKMVEIDGAQYKIFQLDHTGPDIHGQNSTFKQYYSVRQSKRTSGHITVSDHFKAWKEQGWGIGLLYEVALNAEGYQSSGVADVTKLDVYTEERDPDHTGSNPITTTTPPEPVPEISYDTPKSGDGSLTDNFDDGSSDWAGRGDNVTVGVTKDFVHSGDRALYVTNRSDTWQGFSGKSSELKAGGSYDISAYVGYNDPNYSSASFTLGLQYTSNGKENYDNLFKASATSGKWTEIGGSFEIPSDATDISIYIQTDYDDSTTAKLPFFLDDVRLSQIIADYSTTATTTTTTTTSTMPETTTTPKSDEPVAQGKAGDVDLNGDVNVADAVLLARFCAEEAGISISAQGKANANVNGDTLVNGDDLAAILEYLAGIVTSL